MRRADDRRRAGLESKVGWTSGKWRTSDSPSVTVPPSTAASSGGNEFNNQGISHLNDITLQRKVTCVKMLMDTMEGREELRKEESVLSRLQEEEQKKERVSSKEEENEAAEFNRLHSLLPFLGSKSVTELDIVLEAITYIHLLQARLQGAPQRQ